MDCTPLFRNARKASHTLNVLDSAIIDKILLSIAEKAIDNTEYILTENQKDLALMKGSDPRFDRLKLTADRIEEIAADMQNVANLPNPLGNILMKNKRQNGLVITKISVPFGIVGIIFEARPNVTFDVFSLCLKSGNACILKGGSDAIHSNTAIVKLIHEVLAKYETDKNILTLLPLSLIHISEPTRPY